MDPRIVCVTKLDTVIVRFASWYRAIAPQCISSVVKLLADDPGGSTLLIVPEMSIKGSPRLSKTV